jgi:hypothetical protein
LSLFSRFAISFLLCFPKQSETIRSEEFSRLVDADRARTPPADPASANGGLELLRLLEQFLDQALCFATEALSSTSSCRIDRALTALVARSSPSGIG